jgi:hypothetical protein
VQTTTPTTQRADKTNQVWDAGRWPLGDHRERRRPLSVDVCASFTGWVVGPYAKSGVVDLATIRFVGQDIQR